MRRAHVARRVTSHCVAIVPTYVAAGIALIFSLFAIHAYADEPHQSADVPWSEIAANASEFVARESGPNVFPFRQSNQTSAKRVFIHYFPFWVLSFDNKPIDSDYWSQNYNSTTGNQAKYARQGGFYRERPITPPPWPSPFWDRRNLAIDVLRAKRLGADGFLLDLPAVQGRAWDIAIGLCDVAAHVAPGFKIALEPGMVGLGPTIDPERLSAALEELNACPAAYHLADGRLLIAPFAAERQPPEFWKELEQLLAARNIKTAFLPIFLEPSKFAENFRERSIGMSYWGEADVNSVNSQSSRRLHQMFPVVLDPVRPQDMRPKASIFWEAQNTMMYRLMWERAIENGTPYVQVITWNDLSEGTEIEPGSAIQFLFYDLTAYYISWFRTGHAPEIISDAIYYSSRSQLITSDRPQSQFEEPMRLLGRTPVENNIEMVAFLKAPARMIISVGGKAYEKEANAGMAVFSIPASWGRPRFEIVRAGKTIAAVDAHYTILQNPKRQDPLYYGGSSNRKVSE